MVLTNFECWAHGGSDNLSVNGLIERRGNSVDLFNPAVLQQSCNGVSNGGDVHASVQEHVKNVSHLSSNGYYGFVACNVDDNRALQDDISKTTGGNNNDVNKQHELYAASATIATTTGDDTMDTMDVEQHHMAAGAGSQGLGRGCDGIEVDSMFLRREPALAATSLVVQQSNSNNGFGSDRRKRLLMRDERMLGMGAESGAVKRFRHDIGNREFHSVRDENKTMYPSAVQTGKQFVMEQDDVAVNVSTENQMVLNFPAPNLIYQQHHSYGQSQMLPMSGHVIDPPKSLNKRKQNSTHSLDIDQNHRKPFTENSDVGNSCNMLPPSKKRVTFYHVNDRTFTYNQLQTNFCGDDTKNKFQHFVDTNLSNTTANCSVDDQVHKYHKNDDDILESLFLSLHGGSNRHVWRHLSNCINDEI